MNKIFLIMVMILLIVTACSSRETIVKPDYCAERGHVLVVKYAEKKTNDIIKIEDYKDRSLKITNTGKMVLYQCARCGKSIDKFEIEKSDTTIIWQIKKER